MTTESDTGTDGHKLPPFDDPKYRAALGDCDVTEEQATEFLRNLDFILRTIVDLSWGLDAVQLALPELAKISLQCESLADFSGGDGTSTGTVNQSDAFNDVASIKDREQERND